MRTSSFVVAAVASLFFLSPAQAQYEGLSKFHWKRFIDKNEKQTAALIAADLARAAAEYRVAETMAEARMAHFQNRIALVEPIDWKAHEERVQLSAVMVTVTGGEASSARSETDVLRNFAAKIADRENLTTGSTRKLDDPAMKQNGTSSADQPWWAAPILSFLSKLGW